MTAGRSIRSPSPCRTPATTWSEGDWIRMGVSGITRVMQRCSDPRSYDPGRGDRGTGAAHTFAFTMTAPETAGTYTHNTACSRRKPVVRETLQKTVQVTTAAATVDAVIVSNTIPDHDRKAGVFGLRHHAEHRHDNLVRGDWIRMGVSGITRVMQRCSDPRELRSRQG